MTLKENQVKDYITISRFGIISIKRSGISFLFKKGIDEINNDIIYVHSVLDGRRNVQEILSNRILR